MAHRRIAFGRVIAARPCLRMLSNVVVSVKCSCSRIGLICSCTRTRTV